MLDDIKLGINAYFEALGFVIRHKLWYYFILPILFSLIVFVMFIALKAEIIAFINDYLMQVTGYDRPADEVEGWLGTIIRFFVVVTVWIVGTFIFWTFNKYIVLITLSPVLAILSERTEAILTGKKYPLSVSQFTSDIIRGILLALRNMLIELGLLVALSIATIIFPIMSPVTLVLLFLISAYFYGYSMIDYNSERHRLSVKEGSRLVNRNRILAASNGAFFDLLMRIPVIGVTFAPILGCVGATLALHKKYNLNKNLKTVLP